jgi:transcriptional regulator with XRE-family HTH domain
MSESVTRTRLAVNLKRLLSESTKVRTQSDIATRAGLAVATVNGLFTGKRGTTLDVVDRVATALGVDVADLFAAPRPSDPPRHGPRDSIDPLTTGGRNVVASSSVVRALRALIENFPDAAAEAFAAALETVDPAAAASAEPGRVPPDRKSGPGTSGKR